MRSMRNLTLAMLLASLVPAQQSAMPRLDGAPALDLILKQSPPDYPPIAVAARLQGVVHVVVQLGANGKLKNSMVTSGPAMLLQAALDAVDRWKFRAYLVNGVPTPVSADYDIVFRLP